MVDINDGKTKTTRLKTAQSIREALDKNKKDENPVSQVDKEKPKPADKKKIPKGWRNAVGGGFDHQFYDAVRLDQLEKKANDWAAYETNPEAWNKEVPPEFTAEDAEERE